MGNIAGPLVSVITPTYNHERFIRQCIDSVKAQTYLSWEQIIIDDGSSDSTGEIARSYDDKRIRYVRQDRGGIWGLSATYNRALQMAQGDLVAILEGDDFWPPTKLEKQVPAFDGDDVVLSWGKVQQVNTQGRVLWTGPNDFESLRRAPHNVAIKRLLFHGFIPACTVMCRKSSLLSIGGFRQTSYTPFVDYSTWLELSLLGRFAAVDDVLGFWRTHAQQISSTMVLQMFEGSRYPIEFLERMPEGLARETGVTIDQLERNYHRQMKWAAFNLGRIALINHDWPEAKTQFRGALDSSLVFTKLGALFGLICAYSHIDAEWMAAVLRRPRFK